MKYYLSYNTNYNIVAHRLRENGFFVFNNTAFFKRFWFESNNTFSLLTQNLSNR